MTNKKKLTDLKRNIACYFEQDSQELIDSMALKFENSLNIPVIETRIFKNFINSKSNLYKNNFERVSNLDEQTQKKLNEQMLWLERYFHVSMSESRMYIKSIDEFLALDPSQYIDVENKVFVQSDEDVLLFEVGQKVKISKRKDVSIYDTSTINYNDFVEISESKTIIELPFLTLKAKRISVPFLNPLINVEREFISAISWGMYNTSPKMLTQFQISSDLAVDDVRKRLDYLGKTTKAILLGTSDGVKTVDVGDLKNLLDLFTAWKIVIEQRAVNNGVDKNSVYVQGELISGEAKKVELNYINESRKDYFSMFENFEIELSRKMSLMFNKNITIESVTFLPLSLTEENTVTNNQQEQVYL